MSLASNIAALELRNISKRYPGVVANENVSLVVGRGEVHGLVGENGAGKSTLMSIAYGLVQPDAGEIIVAGQPLVLRSSSDAIRAGLGMVHQSFRLFGSLTVAENVVFHAEPTRYGLIDRAQAVAIVGDLADRHGLKVDPAARVDHLPVGVRQRIEILKALYRDANVLILDEPTAVLTPQERDGLFDILRRLVGDGHSIVLVTHKMPEVMALTDRVTVMRDGRVVANLTTAATSPAEISWHMTGRNIALGRHGGQSDLGRPVLEVNDLTVNGRGDYSARPAVAQVSFAVRSGEIVGIAGVAGNGQTELVEAICGLCQVNGGAISIDGTDVTTRTVRQRRAAGLAYIPEDRYTVGSADGASVSDNLALGYHRRLPLCWRGWIDRKALRSFAVALIDRFGIKVAQPESAASTLSGGNLQKVVIAREISHGSALLVAEQPTRGVDVGAIEYIHRQLVDYRDSGHGVLLVSAELSEIFALADRIIVMFEGRIVADENNLKPDERRIGMLMAGAA